MHYYFNTYNLSHGVHYKRSKNKYYKSNYDYAVNYSDHDINVMRFTIS